jgi:PHD/YefM family antitoxin component YafN of YafNO toxin-antitoxin module
MKEMKEFSSQDLQKRMGEVQDAALVAPIAITHHGRRRHVMMSIAEFERLEKAASPRVYRLADLPDDLAGTLAGAEMDPRHADLDKLLDD